MVRHKEEKRQREAKTKDIPKPKPKKEEIKEKIEEEPIQPKPSKRNGIILACCIAFIALSGIVFTFTNAEAQGDSKYLIEARPIYNSGYDDASNDVWYNASTDKKYQQYYEFIQTVGGYTGNETGKHYIPNINSADGINSTEKELIYATGYTNGFADSMIHGYNTQRNNIPE